MFGNAIVDKKRVAIYIRWSTDEQSQGTTLEVQRDACRHFLLSQGWEFREDLVFVDDGYSGANLDRPAMTALREAAQAGRVSAVVVYKLDRLSRNLLDCVTLVRQEWAKVALFSTTEHFDTQSSLGQMVFNLLVSFAEFERNVIRERTMSGKKKRREQGRNSGFRYPYGYKKGAEAGFEIYEEQAQVVRRMFRDYIHGMGIASLADALNKDGIPAPKGGLWRACTVSLILTNPFYAGHYAPGAARERIGNQKEVRPSPVFIRNAVPAIVTQADYDKAQRVRQERLHPGWPVRVSSDYLLSTVLKCGKCGGPMMGHANQEGRQYYRCANAKDLRNCDNGGVPKDEIEERVLEEVRRAYSPERMLEHLAQIQESRLKELERCRKAIQEMDAKITERNRKRERIDEEYLAGEIDSKMYKRLIERLEEEVVNLTEQREGAIDELRLVERLPVNEERIRQMAEQLDGLSELSGDQVRKVLRSLFTSLTAYRVKKRGRWNLEPVEMVMEHNVKVLAGN
ncbi:MAG TPA: recombinase family protein [Symbiobacteriaceae bacterium]|nr:recombinase family protein [Symbiobacteriaceae bacterium]